MSEKQSHTPGPWVAEKDPNTSGSFNIFGSFNEKGDGMRLAIVMSGPADFTKPAYDFVCPEFIGCQGEANARLICTAPEVVKEARELLRLLDAIPEQTIVDLDEDLWDQFTKMRETLTKAGV